MLTQAERDYIRYLINKETFHVPYVEDGEYNAKTIVQLGHSINNKLRDDGIICHKCQPTPATSKQ